ncbi:MAG: general secretion pathway protein GspK [Haliea sp.]|nr:general secretion pathway protein GspK [Haliea sp.]
MQARIDLKLAQLHATRAQVEAAADGAMQLGLADLMLPDEDGILPSPVMHRRVYTMGGYDVSVEFTPVSGLIDINSAPEGLLTLLFSTVEGLDETMANVLALNVVEWRSVDPFGEGALPGLEQEGMSVAERGLDAVAADDQGAAANIRHGRFEAIEDLLLVSGIDRQVFEAVQDAVYVSQRGQAGVNWASAPVPVLRALGGLDEAAAQELVQFRMNNNDHLGGQLAPEGIDLSFQQATELPIFRIDARVQVDGSNFNRRRWVDLAMVGADGLPWRFFSLRSG